MQNEMMDLIKQFNDNAMGSAKRFGDLNMKTFETLTAKQSELLNACVESSTKNVEAISKVKTPQEAAQLQQAAMQDCGEKWMTSAREAMELLTSTRDEIAAMTEETTQYMTNAAEKVTELNKQAANEGFEKVTETVEKAMAKTAEMTEEVAVASKEATDKVVKMSKEVAEKTLEATKKAAAEAKAA